MRIIRRGAALQARDVGGVSPPLLALLALLASQAFLAPPLSSQDRPLSRWDQLARSLFEELVEINTTQSAGDMTKAAEAMARHLRAAGFPDSDVVVIQSGEPRKGNLIARLRGRNQSLKPVLLLSHLDVVEANREDWTLPPFEFIEREGTFYGRGVADDKDEGAIGLAILMRLKAEGYVPDRTSSSPSPPMKRADRTTASNGCSSTAGS